MKVKMKCPNCKKDWNYWGGIGKHGECDHCGFVYSESKQGTPGEQVKEYKK